MTTDEKFAVIAGNLRDSLRVSEKVSAIVKGSLFELAEIAAEKEDAENALETARLVIPEGNRMMLAEFCRLYHKCRGSTESPFPNHAVTASTVMIPEISRLDDVIGYIARRGIHLERHFGDSFSYCAEEVEYGHAGYVLMPLSDPKEGRLSSFERLREEYGLRVHCVVNIPSDDSGDYSYQLCALGFPDLGNTSATRFSFTAHTRADVLSYLGALSCFGATVLSTDIAVGEISRVRAVLDISDTDNELLSGLVMYLNIGADMTVDGIYAEI